MTSPTPEEKIISPDDEDWNWRAGQRLIDEVVMRCLFLAESAGTKAHIIERDLYRLSYWAEEFHIYVGDSGRVKIYHVEEFDIRAVLATHAQMPTDWKLIQTALLPMLRTMMVLDDLANA